MKPHEQQQQQQQQQPELEQLEQLADVSSFVSEVAQFCNNPELSDLILNVSDQATGRQAQYDCHRFVLAKSSIVFQTMLYSENWAKEGERNGSVTQQLDLSEDSDCYDCFLQFLTFLYSGSLSISCSSAIGILRLSDKYNVQHLRTLTEQFMSTRAEAPNIGNALLWFSWAKQLQLQRLAGVCFDCVGWNVKQLAALPEFLHVGFDLLHDLLSSDAIVVEDEFALLQLLLTWLRVHNRMQLYAEQFISLIRFPMMTAAQLFYLESHELSQLDDCRQQMQQQIASAYRFRSLCPYRSEVGVDFSSCSQFRPRNYTSLAVDSIKIGNSTRFGFQVDIRTQSSAVPSQQRDSEWKMVYQKQGNSWQFKLISHDSSLSSAGSSCSSSSSSIGSVSCGSFGNSSGTVVQIAILAENDLGQVVEAKTSEALVYTRPGQQRQFNCDWERRDAKNLTVLMRILCTASCAAAAGAAS